MSDDVSSFNLYNGIVDIIAVVGKRPHLEDSRMVIAFETM